MRQNSPARGRVTLSVQQEKAGCRSGRRHGRGIKPATISPTCSSLARPRSHVEQVCRHRPRPRLSLEALPLDGRRTSTSSAKSQGLLLTIRVPARPAAGHHIRRSAAAGGQSRAAGQAERNCRPLITTIPAVLRPDADASSPGRAIRRRSPRTRSTGWRWRRTPVAGS